MRGRAPAQRGGLCSFLSSEGHATSMSTPTRFPRPTERKVEWRGRMGAAAEAGAGSGQGRAWPVSRGPGPGCGWVARAVGTGLGLCCGKARPSAQGRAQAHSARRGPACLKGFEGPAGASVGQTWALGGIYSCCPVPGGRCPAQGERALKPVRVPLSNWLKSGGGGKPAVLFSR